MSNLLSFRPFFLVLLLCLILTGCSGRKHKPETSAEEYFSQGERYYEKNLYDDAIASWEKARDTFYSPELSKLVDLKIAEAYYVSERYQEATVAYNEFIQKYPNDTRIPEILYSLGMSYYRQILSRDRDQTNTENALLTFEDLNRRFPDNNHAAEVDNLILRSRTRLADHEVYVGWFYLKKKRYQASIQRLENVLRDFPDYYYRDEAYYYLIKAYVRNGETAKAQEVYQQLSRQFPNSDKTADAQSLIARHS